MIMIKHRYAFPSLTKFLAFRTRQDPFVLNLETSRRRFYCALGIKSSNDDTYVNDIRRSHRVRSNYAFIMERVTGPRLVD